MKDRFLKRQLEMYADAAELNEELLADAYREMDILSASAGQSAFAAQKNHPNRIGVTKGLRLAAVAAVLVLIVSFVVYPLITNNNGQEASLELNEYSFASLSRSFATLEEIEAAGARFLTPDSATATGEYYLFKNRKNGNIYVAAAKYKIRKQNGNMDEVIVISDFRGGLTEYPELPDGSYIYDEYQNGEYYSYICVHEDGQVFYLFVMSPDRNAAYIYEEIIF